jgi:DegV family protein with EDD domain
LSAVAVVTDSTSYLPEGLAEELGIVVVPLYVTLGDRSGTEGIEISADLVADALRDGSVPVRTSRPSPAAFSEAYESLLSKGAEGVVSLQLSAELSGTWEAARLAANEVDPKRVRVVDSRSIAMGLGFGAIEAAHAANAGATLDETFDAAGHALARTRVLFYVDTLEYLRKGGRISGRSAMLGTALSVKPLLHLVDGRIEMLEKVRTASKAIRRLQALATEDAGFSSVDIAVHHLGSPVRAFELANTLEFEVPGLEQMYQSDLGAVIGAHTGPGVVGVVVRHR